MDKAVKVKSISINGDFLVVVKELSIYEGKELLGSLNKAYNYALDEKKATDKIEYNSEIKELTTNLINILNAK